jgi:beta-lactamase class A
MYAYAYHPRKQKHSPHPFLGTVFWLALLIAAGWGLMHWFNPVEKISVSWSSFLAPKVKVTTPAFVPLDVEQSWRNITAKYPGITVAAELRDADDDLVADINQNHIFTAASTTKMITACFFLHQVEQGNRTMDDQVGPYTADFQLQQLVNQSNNDSWEAFLDLLGRDNEQTYAKQIGLTSFNVWDNTIDADDLAVLLQKLWQGDLLNKEHTTQLLSLMQNTIEDQWIPPALASGDTVYHKYGALNDTVHDAAIIQHNGRNYVLVIMTDGNGDQDENEREALFHDLVKATFAPPPTPTESAVGS